LNGGSSYRALEKKVAAMEAKLSGTDGLVVALTQSVGFLLGVLATRPENGDVISVVKHHFTRERDRLKASGKFSEIFLSDYAFAIETVSGTAEALATAMKNRREPGGNDGG
jgi:hypothetical protein